MANVRRETIIRLEQGKYKLSLRVAMEIARILETSVYHLFVYGEDELNMQNM